MKDVIAETSDLWEIPVGDILNLTDEEFQQRNGIYIPVSKRLDVSKDIITLSEFSKAATKECRAIWAEYRQAKGVTFEHYKVNSKAFLQQDVYPTWRMNKSNTGYIGVYEKDDAFSIKYESLAKKNFVLDKTNFHPGYSLANDYFTKTNTIIVFHCQNCGVYVIKDGNHRLLQTVVKNQDKELDVFQVSSGDWTKATVDMKNFCKCRYFTKV